jgi:hypothetical protein
MFANAFETVQLFCEPPLLHSTFPLVVSPEFTFSVYVVDVPDEELEDELEDELLEEAPEDELDPLEEELPEEELEEDIPAQRTSTASIPE